MVPHGAQLKAAGRTSMWNVSTSPGFTDSPWGCFLRESRKHIPRDHQTTNAALCPGRTQGCIHYHRGPSWQEPRLQPGVRGPSEPPAEPHRTGCGAHLASNCSAERFHLLFLSGPCIGRQDGTSSALPTTDWCPVRYR